MTIRRWDPLSDLLGLQEKMNRLFEESLASARLEGSPLSGAWVPPADAYETADGFVVEVELPGVRDGEVEVHATECDLVVRGERRPEDSSRPGRFLRMERSFGPFGCSFRFETPVDASRVEARLEDGLLLVVLPKARAPRRGRGDRE
jgi:HSP20 family protein